jgi:hypothetical protein
MKRICKDCTTALSVYNKKPRCFICARKQAMLECNVAPKKNYYIKKTRAEKIQSGYFTQSTGGDNVYIGRNQSVKS